MATSQQPPGAFQLPSQRGPYRHEAPPLAAVRPPRPRRRWFRWAFLALQAVMLLFTIVGAGGGPPASCTGACASAWETQQGLNILEGVGLWAGLDVIAFGTWAAFRLDR